MYIRLWQTARFEYLNICVCIRLWQTARFEYLNICVYIRLWQTARFEYLNMCVYKIVGKQQDLSTYIYVYV